jgi:hypothetical protein
LPYSAVKKQNPTLNGVAQQSCFAGVVKVCGDFAVEMVGIDYATAIVLGSNDAAHLSVGVGFIKEGYRCPVCARVI